METHLPAQSAEERFLIKWTGSPGNQVSDLMDKIKLESKTVMKSENMDREVELVEQCICVIYRNASLIPLGPWK